MHGQAIAIVEAMGEIEEAGNDSPSTIDPVSVECENNVGPISLWLFFHQQMVILLDVPDQKSQSENIGQRNTAEDVGGYDEQLTVPGKDPSVVENHVDAINNAVSWAGNDGVQIHVPISRFSLGYNRENVEDKG